MNLRCPISVLVTYWMFSVIQQGAAWQWALG